MGCARSSASSRGIKLVGDGKRCMAGKTQFVNGDLESDVNRKKRRRNSENKIFNITTIRIIVITLVGDTIKRKAANGPCSDVDSIQAIPIGRSLYRNCIQCDMNQRCVGDLRNVGFDHLFTGTLYEDMLVGFLCRTCGLCNCRRGESSPWEMKTEYER